jgi:WD40 repeat protein
MRTHLAVYQEMIHKGSVNCLNVDDGKIITGSADHTLRVFSYPGMKSMHKIDAGDMILAM